MTAPRTDDCYLAELTVYDPGIAGTRTLYYSTGAGFVTTPSDTPANTVFSPRISEPINVKRDVFASGATGGASRPSFGELVLINEDGALDALVDYAFDGRAIVVRVGPKGAAYPGGFTTVFSGTMEQPLVTMRTVNIRVRDRQYLLDVPLQATKYAGDNALPDGLEGVSDLVGKPKPICYGKVLNVAPPCVNTSKLIYQVNDGAIDSVDAVYDSGDVLGPGVNYASHTSGFGATQIRGFAFGAGLYVAVGESGKLFTSPDGITWTSRTSTFGASGIFGITFAAGIFVIVGELGKCATSSDGITWTSRTTVASATSVNIYCVAYSTAMSLFVLGRFDTGIAETSPDAITWTSRTTVSGFTMVGVTAFAGLFIGVGSMSSQQAIISSPDGITWTTRLTGTAGGVSGFTGVAASANLVVAVGSGGASNTATTATSVDGLNWISRSGAFGSGHDLQAIAYGTDRFIAVGPNGVVASSQNGENWVVRDGTTPLGASAFCWAVGFGNTSPEHVIGADAGALILGSAATYANSTDLLDDDLAPDAGTFIHCPSAGYFRLGSSPAGLVTADVTQGASAADRTAAQIATQLFTLAGLSSGDWSASDVTALDVANDAVLGYWSGTEETTIADVMDLVADSVGAWWGVDRTGVFRIKQFTVPSGSAVLTITANDLKKGLERRPTTDSDRGIPVYRVVLHYAKNGTIQTTDLAGGVSDDRRAVLALPSLTVVSTDTSVQTAHLLATQIEKDTLLTDATDAQDEADRLQAMFGTKRDRFELSIQLTSDTATLDLGDVVTLQHARYGLSAGKKFRVLGIDPKASAREMVLSIWGGV